MNKKERLAEIIESVRTIPVSSIIERRIEIFRRGSSVFAYCPFHADTHLGSFVITDNKGIWKCFSCPDGIGGDGPRFISLYDRISYMEAVLKIAVEFDIITETEASKLKKSSKGYKIQEITVREKINPKETNRSDEKTIHMVYSIIKDGKLLEGEDSPLTKEHREYLHKRGINDEDIERNGYFSFPTRKAKRKILSRLRKRGFDETILVGVPGFYREIKKNKMTFSVIKGIGIPIYNGNRKIIGIQIRRDEVKEGQSRYVWFSSAFADMCDDLDSGTAQGAPVDVCIPDEMKTATMFLTEGHFKADVLRKRFNSVSMSVQGIGNWQYIDQDIKTILQKFNSIKYIYVAFDADMSHNINVGLQAIKMTSFIKRTFPELKIGFMLWDEEKGKGIDDLLENVNDAPYPLFKVKDKDFELQYNKMLMLLMKRMDVFKASDIVRAMIEQFGKEDTKKKLALSYKKIVYNPLQRKYGDKNNCL